MSRFSKPAFQLPARYFVKPGPPNPNTIGRWIYNTSSFRRYGLHFHDTWCTHHYPEFKIAIERLPPSLKDPRDERIYNALQLFYAQKWLPVDQWTKYEEDLRYLTPFLEEVHREAAEKNRYEKTAEFY